MRAGSVFLFFIFGLQWSQAGPQTCDGERRLCKSENKFPLWLAWAMAQWGFIVPAKVIRENNCVLYCPRMSGPNWAQVPHPSTHDGVWRSIPPRTCVFVWCIVGEHMSACEFIDSCLYMKTTAVIWVFILIFSLAHAFYFAGIQSKYVRAGLAVPLTWACLFMCVWGQV